MSNAQSTTRLHVLLFTDLLDSSLLKVELGDDEYVEQIAQPHNEIFRELLTQFPGAEENNYTGDGFLATFCSVKDAVNFALLFHHALRTFQWKGVVASTRIGIHIGDTVEFDTNDHTKLLASHAADMCARVMGLGDGGQTLLTRAAFDSARQFVRKHPEIGEHEHLEIQWLAHGRYLFKGKDEPMEVFEVGAVGIAPLKAPASSEKAKRALSPEEEQTLGWRPGTKLEIPGRSGWSLQEKLGEGGFGEVWLAQHDKLREERVFKFCFDADRLRSYKRELTLFRLIQQGLGNRDDIARLLDVRIDQPPFFLESEYVPSGNLSQWVELRGGLGKISLPMRLKILADVAKAVAAAHSLGIIHKDIKPSNVLIGESADGTPQPKLADFGIGVLTDHNLLKQHQVTETGFTESLVLGNDSSRTGTRLYAPPESQVGKPASTAGDVYALGVMLYQLVTGEMSRPLGVGWENDIDDELLREDITACTHNDPEMRLSSVSELAERIEQLDARRAEAEAEMQAAAEHEAAERLAAEQAKRMRVLKVTLGVALLFVVFAGFAAVWINIARTEAIEAVQVARVRAKESRESKRVADLRAAEAKSSEMLAKVKSAEAKSERNKAIEQSQLAFAQFYVSQMALIQQDWDKGDVASLSTRLERTRPEHTGDRDLRGFEWYLWHRRVHGALLALSPPDGELEKVTFSPDGSLVATGNKSGNVWVWDATTAQLIASFHNGAPPIDERFGDDITSLTFAPTGHLLAAGYYDGSIYLWDLKNKDERRTLRSHSSPVCHLAFSPDGKRLASAGGFRLGVSHQLKVWNTVTGQVSCELAGSEELDDSEEGVGLFFGVAWTSDGRQIAAIHGNKLRMWAFSDDKTSLVWQKPGFFDGRLQIGPDDDVVAVVADRTLQQLDAKTGNTIDIVARDGKRGYCREAAFSPDNKLFVETEDQTVTVRSWYKGQPLSTIHHFEEVRDASFSSDGMRLAVCGGSTVKLWDALAGSEVAQITAIGAWNNHNALFPDGGRLVTHIRGRAEVAELLTGEPLLTIESDQQNISANAGTADGRLLAFACGPFGKTTKLIVSNGLTGEKLHSIPTNGETISHIQLGPRGHWLAATLGDNVKVWNLQNVEDVSVLMDAGAGALEFHPTKPELATSGHHKIKLWNLSRKAVEREIAIDFDRFTFVADLEYSKDGDRLAAAVNGNTSGGNIRVWEIATGKLILGKADNGNNFNNVSFNRDGNRLIAGSESGTCTLWELTTKSPVLSVVGKVAVFGTRKLTMAVLNDDGARIWNLANDLDSSPARVRDGYERIAARCEASGQYWTALTYLNQMIKHRPDDGLLHLRRGLANAYIGHSDEALADLAIAKQHGVENLEYWRGRGLANLQRNKWQQAVSDLSEAVRRKSTDHQLYQWRAQAHRRIGNWENAISDLTKAINLTRNRRRASTLYWKRATCYAELMRWKDSASDFEQATQLMKENLDDLDQLDVRPVLLALDYATLQLAMNNEVKYRRICNETLDRHKTTEDKDSAFFVSWLCCIRPDAVNEPSIAQKLAELVVKAEPDSPQSISNLGAALYRNGQFEDAVTQLQGAIDSSEKFKETYKPDKEALFLAMAYHRLGKKEDAKRWLQKGKEAIEKSLSRHSTTAGEDMPWHARIEMQLLLKEAETLLLDSGSR